MVTQTISEPSRDQFRRFLELCREVGADPDVVAAWVKVIAADIGKSKGTEKTKNKYISRWYDSLERGEPDLSCYSGEIYLADAWTCWRMYSRIYVYDLTKDWKFPPDGLLKEIGPVSRAVDVGCGIGFSTLALREVFPDALVLGTNLKDTFQDKVARDLGVVTHEGLEDVRKELGGPADVVFASEYFEHFEHPGAHLEEVLDALEPRILLVANSFGAVAVGHFPRYVFGVEDLDPRETSLRFAKILRGRGYEMLRHRAWNNRPNFWRLK